MLSTHGPSGNFAMLREAELPSCAACAMLRETTYLAWETGPEGSKEEDYVRIDAGLAASAA
jgi:hypothetical protein